MDAVNFLLLVLLGIGIGFLASLFGIGGGFLLVPTMIMFVGLDTHTTVGTVAFVILGMALSSTIAYGRQKRIDYKIAGILTIFSVIGAVLGAITTKEVSSAFILVGFGTTEAILAIILGTKKTPQEKYQAKLLKKNILDQKNQEEENEIQHNGEGKGNLDKVLSFQSQKDRNPEKWYILARTHVDSDGIKYEYTANLLAALPLSLLAGFLSSLLGIGGGTLYIQIFVFLCGMSIHMAIACSIFAIFISTISSTITFAQMGQINWSVGLTYMIGMMIGAQLGALVSKKIKSKHLKPMAALMIVIIAVRMIYFALVENPV